MNHLTCFKAYDIRGRLPDELNEDIAWSVGRAFSAFLHTKTVVIGGDIRLSTPSLKMALSHGLRAGGTDVIDIGLCGTEEIYFATSHLKADGGIMVTASHNPVDYNGMKLVREISRPISGDTGLLQIRSLAERYLAEGMMKQCQVAGQVAGQYRQTTVLSEYIDHIVDYIDLSCLRPLKLVVNAGNGAAGHVIDAIERPKPPRRINIYEKLTFQSGAFRYDVSKNINPVIPSPVGEVTRKKLFNALSVPVEFIKIHHEPDGHFPHGIPNPLLPECRQATIDAVLEHKADMGIAWDGDFDRCFLFDEKGQFIEGYYIVGLLGEAFQASNPGAKVIHDPRLTWNTIDQVSSAGGIPVLCKSGHAFIKERMRQEDAVYGGEMSAHHYFRDFAYCDSGMIPWLLVIELMSRKKQTLSALVQERILQYPSSGEINCKLENASEIIDKVLALYGKDSLEIDKTDGISLDMGQWRFNLRSSNTEPVVRLNVESKGDRALMKDKTNELLALLGSEA